MGLLLLAALAMPPLSAHADEEDELRMPPSGTVREPEAPPASSTSSAAASSAATSSDPADGAEAAIKAALARLSAVEIALARGLTSGTRDEISALRGELHDALVALGQLRQDRDTRAWLEDQGYAVVLSARSAEQTSTATNAVPGVPGPLSEDEIEHLRRDIAGAPFNEGKLTLLEEGIRGRTLTAAQAETLLELFSFSRDRVDVLVFVHPRLDRREDFGRLLSALKFESDRQAVRDRLGLDS